MARHALLIGVSQFEDPRLAALNAPTSDVEAFGAVLQDPERGRFDSVAISLDEDYLALRDRLATLFEERSPADTLLLYYSGHGILGRGNRLFLATPNSNLDRPQARSLSAAEIRDFMDQTRTERQIMVLDCCHSGAFTEGTKGIASPAVTQDTFDSNAAGRYVLAAASALQFAWDGKALRDGSSAERHLSRFTSWLVDGLGRGEAAAEEEWITIDALFRYLCRRAKAEGSQSTPQLYNDRRTGDLVIGRNPTATGLALQDWLAKLAADDWTDRSAAAEELVHLARRDGLSTVRREALIEALSDRLGVERDYQVRAAVRQVLTSLEQPSVSPKHPPISPERPPVAGAHAQAASPQLGKGEPALEPSTGRADQRQVGGTASDRREPEIAERREGADKFVVIWGICAMIISAIVVLIVLSH